MQLQAIDARAALASHTTHKIWSIINKVAGLCACPRSCRTERSAVNYGHSARTVARCCDSELYDPTAPGAYKEMNGINITFPDVQAAFQEVLDNHPEISGADLTRLRLTKVAVTEAQDGEASLSDAILDACFPHADTNLEYVHYTTFSKFCNAVASGEWRLYSLLKRITEAEFTTFCQDHGLTGYLMDDPTARNPRYIDLCRDLFYTSMTTPTDTNEDEMWNVFGEHGCGVRLTFRIKPVGRRSQFRPVRYRNSSSQTILQELSQAARVKLGRTLVLMGISRIGAFYLPFSLSGERESRLLVKRFPDAQLGYDPWACVRKDGDLEYLPIPLNSDNDLCRIDLIRAEAGPSRPQSDVNDVLHASATFGNLPELL